MNLTNSSNFFERMLLVAEKHGITGVPGLAEALGYSSPEKLYRLDRVNEKTGERNNPSFELVRDLANKFEDMDVRWLVTGKGIWELQPSTVSEPSEKYVRELEQLREQNTVLEHKYAALLEAFERIGKGRQSPDSNVG